MKNSTTEPHVVRPKHERAVDLLNHMKHHEIVAFAERLDRDFPGLGRTITVELEEARSKRPATSKAPGQFAVSSH